MAALLGQDRRRLQRSFLSAGNAAKDVIAAISAARSKTKASAGGAGAGSGSAGSPSSLTLAADATHAFWEVLSYWELLEDFEIERAFLEALVQVMVTNCAVRGGCSAGVMVVLLVSTLRWKGICFVSKCYK